MGIFLILVQIIAGLATILDFIINHRAGLTQKQREHLQILSHKMKKVQDQLTSVGITPPNDETAISLCSKYNINP